MVRGGSAPLADPALVPRAVTSALGVREQTGRSLADTLADYVRPKQLLLILDNCEHLIDACAQLADTLLRACPSLKILASSREALGIAGEVAWSVPSLSLPGSESPPTFAQAMQYEAVRLFVERATAAQPAFALTEQNVQVVVRICRRLDGIPLALELAAVRLKALSLEQIEARLDDRFRLLMVAAAPPCHASKPCVPIDWSHNLLSEPERVLFGGCRCLRVAGPSKLQRPCAQTRRTAPRLPTALHMSMKSCPVCSARRCWIYWPN